jgi:hypothetical protein
MPFVPFHDHFPEIAKRETRTITVLEHSSLGLPPGHYSLLEMYCDEPGCDCRRVFFYVISSLRKDVEAVIAYGWENPEFYARWMRDDDPNMIKELQGPVLNLGSPQSDLAPAILDIVQNVVLRDEFYVERLKTHYTMFRNKIDSKKAVAPRRRNIKKTKKRKKTKKKRKA